MTSHPTTSAPTSTCEGPTTTKKEEEALPATSQVSAAAASPPTSQHAEKDLGTNHERKKESDRESKRKNKNAEPKNESPKNESGSATSATESSVNSTDSNGELLLPNSADRVPVHQKKKKKKRYIADGAEGAVLRHLARAKSLGLNVLDEEAEAEPDPQPNQSTTRPVRSPSHNGGLVAASNSTTSSMKRRKSSKADLLFAHQECERRRASADIPRSHKDRSRAFWHRERTPRRGILVRSLSDENLVRVKCTTSDSQSPESESGDRVRVKHKRKKHSKRHNESVKFDRVFVRYYPREVCLGGCMLNPKQGPFLGIGWDWAQEDVHNLHSFERLREPARMTDIHAITPQDRYALLVNYGIEPEELEGLILEMRRKDSEITRRGSSLLPSLWPWKKAT